VYYSASGTHETKEFQRLELDELLKTADIVSLHCPLTELTHHLIGARELALMKQTAYIINVARGAVIDQQALAVALKEGMIAGAGLDVLEDEPIKADDPLLELHDSSRILITPHIAWATVEARNRCVDETYRNVEKWMKSSE
jgi:glycerate dehydrogenase